MPGLKGPAATDDHQEESLNACLSNAADRGVWEGSENGNFILSWFVSDAASLSNVQLRPLFLSLFLSYYNPTGGGETYAVGIFGEGTHTGASLLAHELLGRAFLDMRKQPCGSSDSNTRAKLNANAVKLANRAFIRMHMDPRSRYTR